MAVYRFIHVVGMLAALSLTGCSSDGTESAAGTQPGAGQFEELLAYDWTIAPGEERTTASSKP